MKESLKLKNDNIK